MNHIINAFKNLPRRGQHNFVKILCLALGLAISSVIIAEITANGQQGDQPRYNLAGQRVGKDYRGVVVEQGRKIIIK